MGEETRVKAPTKWASAEDIAAAEERWPRSTADSVWVRQIMAETGLSEATSRLALDLARGDTEGDVVTVDQA